MKILFEGSIAVKAAILSHHRKVFQVIIDSKKRTRDTKFIVAKAKEANIPILFSSREEIDVLATGTTHGGVIAYVGERIFQSLSPLLPTSTFFAFIDGIEDPYNYAYILRSLYACGCNGVITSTRNWENAANIVAKASAGASEYMSIILSSDFAETLTELKNTGIQIVCALRNDHAIPIYSYDFKQPICICIGGERRGLSKDVIALSNKDVFIPYSLDFKNALNATSAATIFAYEILRQRST